MEISGIAALTTQVLWSGFVLSMAFGAIVQRTHFCTMGAVSDIVNMGDWTRMRMWGMAAGVAMIGFFGLSAAGLVDPSKTLYASTRFIWLSALTGGVMFGFGMVLSSGCGSKTLARIGGGSLKSLVVFTVMGLAHTFGLSPSLAGLVAALIAGLTLITWALRGEGFRCFDNLLAGLGIGLVVTAMWWVSANLGYVAEHPETLQETFLATNSGKAEALSFVAPMAFTLDWVMFFSDRSKVLTLGIVSVFGVVAGSLVYAVMTKSFRWEGFRDAHDTGSHLLGAALMGVGGVCAMGCTVGQGLSGISTLSATSFVAVASIVTGCVAGLKYQIWRVSRSI